MRPRWVRTLSLKIETSPRRDAAPRCLGTKVVGRETSLESIGTRAAFSIAPRLKVQIPLPRYPSRAINLESRRRRV